MPRSRVEPTAACYPCGHTMLVRCEQCGAPLDVRDGQVFVQCAYCRATNRVRTLRTLAMETPLQWRPPPQWNAPVDVRHQGRSFVYAPPAATPASSSSSSVGPFIAVVAIFAGTVGVAAALTAGLGNRGLRALSGRRGVDLTLAARYPMLTVERASDPRAQVISGTVEDETDASHVQSNCRGYVSVAPTAWLQVNESATLRIDAAVPGHDAVLMLRTQGGSFMCDDDGGDGLNSRLTLPLVAGRYALWVGTLSSGDSGRAFTLSVHTETALAAAATAMAPRLRPEAFPRVATLDLNGPRQSDHHLAGTTLDTVDLSRATGTTAACRGYVGDGPDVVLRVGSARMVRVTTEGNDDMTLALRRPDGSWLCDDDSGAGMNAMITAQLAPGEYPVWVGSYSASRGRAYSVTVRAGAPRASAPSARPSAGITRRGAHPTGAPSADGLEMPVGWVDPVDPPLTGPSRGKRPTGQ